MRTAPSARDRGAKRTAAPFRRRRLPTGPADPRQQLGVLRAGSGVPNQCARPGALAASGSCRDAGLTTLLLPDSTATGPSAITIAEATIASGSRRRLARSRRSSITGASRNCGQQAGGNGRDRDELEGERRQRDCRQCEWNADHRDESEACRQTRETARAGSVREDCGEVDGIARVLLPTRLRSRRSSCRSAAACVSTRYDPRRPSDVTSIRFPSTASTPWTRRKLPEARYYESLRIGLANGGWPRGPRRRRRRASAAGPEKQSNRRLAHATSSAAVPHPSQPQPA